MEVEGARIKERATPRECDMNKERAIKGVSAKRFERAIFMECSNKKERARAHESTKS